MKIRQTCLFLSFAFRQVLTSTNYLASGGILRARPTDDRSSKTGFLVAVATPTDSWTRIGRAVGRVP